MELQASALSCARPGSGQVGSSCDPISTGSSRRSSQLSNTGGVTCMAHNMSHLLPGGMSSQLQRLHTRVLGGHQDPLYCTSNLVVQVSCPFQNFILFHLFSIPLHIFCILSLLPPLPPPPPYPYSI
jgi:hypothetical protein